MNLTLYGYLDSWIAVDCGMLIRQDLDGNPLQVPDPQAFKACNITPEALIITHGHEDHIGAVVWLWPNWGCPIYATPLAAEMLRTRFAEHGLATASIKVIEPGEACSSDAFNVRFLPVTHSIPESCALIMEAGGHRILHTGDWKIDPDPVIGAPVDEQLFRSLAPVDLVVGDSTNANILGRSHSERQVARALTETIGKCSGRVVVSCFASNLARVLSIARAAASCNRRVSLLGRSMERMVAIARQLDYFDDFPALVPASDLGYLPADEVLVIATGSQGEPRAALSRLAQGRHPHFELTTGDSVIFSAKAIPGNEHLIERLKRGLKRFEVNILDEFSHPQLHASGHPAQEELESLYHWVKPAHLLPVHGEPVHQTAHADLARGMGITANLLPSNGDMIHFDDSGLRLEQRFPQQVRLVQRNALSPVKSDTQARISRHGTLFIAITLAATTTGWTRIGRLLLDTSESSPLDEDSFCDWLDEQLDDIATDTLAGLRRLLHPRIGSWLSDHVQHTPDIQLQLMATETEYLVDSVP
ncbi:ribonuclease J [Halomonas huangheensis]|nr:ribonuclease J [Halomonas huangheensis]ALM54607.1 MBL fold metallo-hydrolase [Halomonas huangheensis]